MQTNATLRHDYTLTEIAALYEQPLMSLIHQAQTICNPPIFRLI